MLMKKFATKSGDGDYFLEMQFLLNKNDEKNVGTHDMLVKVRSYWNS